MHTPGPGTPPLRGVRVLEHGSKGPSQFGAMVLADLGADVIRVDRLTALDRPLAGYDPRLDLLNRGRRSIALDLRHESGADLLLRLVRSSDAVIDPFRPGVTSRLGAGPEECLAANPGLVYARMTGWGEDGPYARTAGHDINFLAASGVLDLIGRADGGPVPPLNLVGDFGGGGMLLAISVLAGVFASRAGAGGQVVDVAMLDASALLATVVHTLRAMDSWGPRGTNLLDTGAPYYDVYETADGGYVSVGAMERTFYEELLRGVGLDGDPAMLAAHQDRTLWTEAKKRLAEAFRTRTRDEWAAEFAGRDACVEPVLNLDEATEHPQVRHRGIYEPRFGVPQPAPAPRFTATPSSVRRPPPLPGEHTDEILEGLGLSAAEREELAAAGVLRTGGPTR
ncbi:alpha-methylacyl-CoA racemase [Amycolatopsis bartoniae]|uniref:CoA transferase n=1 Tax=Amycolatopsis bartoniae TaxID=941986 RepID=A0A8H9IPV0_9PSEU|nr:CaiB/BaiF CoA-transferase family protein [Amycolatopsis bartoniae]MBB2939755.1 alpha-methylacyl-CoA racemase [Amycolatopsis bartoniae]TVT08348.1 CoA transferase [Amycolatopsis bartoniae]GHF36042.1 CoA transferase [Amycolatopsis bartoniae]